VQILVRPLVEEAKRSGNDLKLNINNRHLPHISGIKNTHDSPPGEDKEEKVVE